MRGIQEITKTKVAKNKVFAYFVVRYFVVPNMDLMVKFCTEVDKLVDFYILYLDIRDLCNRKLEVVSSNLTTIITILFGIRKQL